MSIARPNYNLNAKLHIKIDKFYHHYEVIIQSFNSPTDYISISGLYNNIKLLSI